MSKRNFTLLIIILIIIAAAIFGFLYFRPEEPAAPDEGADTNFFAQFNPFAPNPASPATTPPVDVSGYVPPAAEVSSDKLAKVSSMPIAGFGLFSKERLKETTSTAPMTEFVTAVRYVERTTGNIYQTFADKIQERKFSGTVIPKVYEAHFGNRGESVVMRYLKTDERTIETFVGTLPKEPLGADASAINEVKGSFLPNDVKDLSVSPDTSKVFYLFETGDSMVGATLNFLNNKKTQIFDSPFTEWLSQWISGNTIALTTKPSAGVPGFMYTIDSAGKNLIKVLDNINGLTTLGSPNGKLILYGDNNLSLSVFNADTKSVSPLSIRTLPEKCVWGKASDTVYCAMPKSAGFGLYPDIWYQGEVSFNDQLWKVDIKTGNSALLLDPVLAERGEEIDGIKLALDEKENYLFFVNKKDSFLWKLDLK